MVKLGGIPEIIKMSIAYFNHISNNPPQPLEEDIMVFDVDYTLYYDQSVFEIELAHRKEHERLILEGKNDSFDAIKKEYGSLLYGLKIKHGIVPSIVKAHDFLKTYDYLSPDPELKKLLLRIPLKKYVLTNGFKEKAEPILKTLDVFECFEKIYCANDDDKESDSIRKPRSNALKFLMRDLNISENRKIYFFDDMMVNIEAARKQGWISEQITEKYPIHSALKDFIKTYGKEYNIEEEEEKTLCEGATSSVEAINPSTISLE